jgi:hypothetical protein
MANEENLKPAWQKGESGNPAGKPKGAKNRSTIARQWLETTQKAKNPITGVEEILTQEDLGTLAMVKKMREGDVSAYKALMDSGYGAPLQQIEQTILEQPIFPDVSADDFDE